MSGILAAAVVATLPLEGDVSAGGGDYELVEFEVPAGVAEIHIAHDDGSEAVILDWGLWSPSGFRGWGGGLEDDAVVGLSEASRGYLPGPIEAGTWHVVIGKARLADSAHWNVTVTLRDDETLPVRDRAETFAGALAEGPAWYQGDLHVHSRESGDATATFDEIASLASRRGLDFVVLSDHNTVSQHGLVAAFQSTVTDVLFVRGCEITTYAGHGNGIGISDYVDHRIGHNARTVGDLVDDVQAQGGLFVVNHPLLDIGDACIGCAWEHEDTPWGGVAGIEVHTGPYDLWPIFGRNVLDLWDRLLDDGHRIAAVGGSDDHRAGMDLSSTQSPVGSPTTVVFAEELSAAAIQRGLAEGRTVVKLRGPDDPMAELRVIGADDRVAAIGETVAGFEVEIEARVTGGDGMRVLLVRNGESVDSADIVGEDFTHSFIQESREEGDRYRLHVVDGGEVTITSHAFVTFVPGDSSGGCSCGAGGGSPLGSAVLVGAIASMLRRRRRAS